MTAQSDAAPVPDRWPASGIPAHGTRPPFEPGNTAALQHGAYSPRMHRRVGGQLVAGLLAERPDLRDYPEALAAWGRCEARVLLLQQQLNRHGVADANGKLRAGLLRQLNAAENAATRARALLGLDPRSEAQLMRDRAETAHIGVDLVALAARGAAILAARDAEPPGLATATPA